MFLRKEPNRSRERLVQLYRPHLSYPPSLLNIGSPVSAEVLALRDAAEGRLLARINYERADDMPYRGRGIKLARMVELLQRLDNPQQRLKILHVAGTKGKGSVCGMLAGMLQAAGYKTGLFTSPHLDSAEERIVVNGAACPPASFVSLVEDVWPHVLAMDAAAADQGGSGPTYFEIITAMAVLHFAREATDVVVLEVGLGGRLDSTNVCEPLVTVITSISYDHMQQLGSTLALIAGEKAGIIKSGVPIISGVTATEPATVIRATAAKLQAPLLEVARDFSFQYLAPRHESDSASIETPSALSHDGQLDFHYHPRQIPPDAPVLQGTSARNEADPARAEQHWLGLELNLLGAHQGLNAAVALAALQQLREQGWQISEAAARQGLRQTNLPARVEIVRRRPTILLDAAHNVASIKALVATLKDCFPPSPRVLLFATTRDKDERGMLAELLPAFEEVIFTRYLNNPRGVPPSELCELADALGYPGKLRFEDPQAAWEQAQALATADHLICLTGSFFFVAEMRRFIQA